MAGCVHSSMRYLICLLALFTSSVVWCQINATANTTMYRIRYHENTIDPPDSAKLFVLPPGAYWNRQPWKDSVYRFPEFVQSKLVLANGSTPQTFLKLNYNTFYGLMEGVELNGDTCVLNDLGGVREFVLGDVQYRYEPGVGYLEVLTKGKVQLASQRMMAVKFETMGPRQETEYLADLDRSTRSTQSRTYWPYERYWFIVDGKVVRVGSLVLPRAYPELKEMINAYVKQNHIDYRRAEDVRKVYFFVLRLKERESNY